MLYILIMVLFCDGCDRHLTSSYDTGYVVKVCVCGKQYEGDPKDTLIASSFSIDSGFDVRSILHYAPHDRVNQTIDEPCVACGRIYLTQVVIPEVGAWFVCSNPKCGAQFRGDRTRIN
jgi:hypothetical protein